jgi:hypothetical protein
MENTIQTMANPWESLLQKKKKSARVFAGKEVQWRTYETKVLLF